MEIKEHKLLSSAFSIEDLQYEGLEFGPVRFNIRRKSFDDFTCRSITVRVHETAFVFIFFDIVMSEKLFTLTKEVSDFRPMTFEFRSRVLLRNWHFCRNTRSSHSGWGDRIRGVDT